MKELEVVIRQWERDFKYSQSAKLKIKREELDTFLNIVLRSDAEVLIRNPK